MAYHIGQVSPDVGSFRSSRSSLTLSRDSTLVGSPSLNLEGLFAPQTRADPAQGLARARMELASTTRANAQILELRTALADKQRKERRHAADMAQVREDLRQLITLLAGRDAALARMDAALDRTETNQRTLRVELAETRAALDEARESHHAQLARLRQQHDTRLRQLVDQHEAELMLSQQQFTDLRCELEARDEQLDSLRHALDAMTSPRAPPLTFLHATPSPTSIFSLPVTPAGGLSPSARATTPLNNDTAERLATLEARNAALAQSLALKEDEYLGLAADMLSLREQLQEMQMSHVDLLSSKETEISRLKWQLDDANAGAAKPILPSLTIDGGEQRRAPSRMRQPSITPKVIQSATFGHLTQAQAPLRTRSANNMTSSKSAGALAVVARPTLHALSSASAPALPSSTSAPMLAVGKPKARARSATYQASQSLKPAANLRTAVSLSRKTGSKLDSSTAVAPRRPSTAALVPLARSRVVSSSSALSISSDSSALANVTNSVELRSSGSSSKIAA
ncbi:hypothetical protein AURDEDRAFT_181687 [Auricularia subglabra TFB-10046 SS5]|nr:hypothetical protein AURDEDRAFT_181687 [Auricularia subglabra TFB-10046 SS5]